MCGRYSLLAEEDIDELREIIRQVGQDQIKTGEIFPTNPAPVLIQGGHGLEAQAVAWGFPRYQGSGVVINARAETAAEKRTFQSSLAGQRCAVPSTGFYEWDAQKNKYRFTLPGSKLLYMAGLYRDFPGGRRFVILTTAANPSMAGIHDRMPVILQPGELEPWTHSLQEAAGILHREPPPLARQDLSDRPITLPGW